MAPLVWKYYPLLANIDLVYCEDQIHEVLSLILFTEFQQEQYKKNIIQYLDEYFSSLYVMLL